MSTVRTGRIAGVVPFAHLLDGSVVVATRLGLTTKHAVRRAERAVTRCGHDWIDGACPRLAAVGKPGWECRTGRAGDHYWLCPTHAAEFPKEAE